MFQLLVVAMGAIVPHDGCDDSQCSGTGDCVAGYAYNGSTSVCEKECDGTTSACYGVVVELVNSGAQSQKNMLGWVLYDNTTRRTVYVNCSDGCDVQTYLISTLRSYRDSGGVETWSTSYHSTPAFKTQHQILIDEKKGATDDPDYDYTGIVVGSSIGGAILLLGFGGIVYYRMRNISYTALRELMI